MKLPLYSLLSSPSFPMKFHPSIPVRQRRIDTPLGRVLLAATPSGLAGLWFEGQRHSPDSSLWPEAPRDDALLQAASAQAQDYFAGRRSQFDLPLDLAHGTPFQQAVWRALLQIGRARPHAMVRWPRRSGCPVPYVRWAPPWGATRSVWWCPATG